MKVYNLTDKTLSYRGRDLPPNGSDNFPELDTFIPDRDRVLEKNKVLAFGALPKWWALEQQVRASKVNEPAQPSKPKIESQGDSPTESSSDDKTFSTFKKAKPDRR